MKLFSIRETPLDAEEARRAVAAPSAGGIDLFIGCVREESEGQAVSLLEYSAYESMAEKQMARIANELENEMEGVKLSVQHRVGQLKVGEIAVICAASAPHRHEAFVACRQLIDRIKAEVPIWKREYGPDGPYWVGWRDARCSGHHG